MIGILFRRLDEVVEIRIQGRSLMIRTNANPNFMPFDTIRLDHLGVLKEFPDLIDDPEWRAKALERFHDKLMMMKSEEEVLQYLMQELKAFGYIPTAIERQGHRVKRIKEGANND